MVSSSDLLHIDIIKDLPEEFLASLVSRLKERNYSEGETVIQRGDPGASLHMILEGVAAATLVNAEGHEYQLARMVAGDIFGEMALLTGEPRSVNVRALSNVKTLELGQPDFQVLIEEHPELLDRFVALLEQRQGRTLAYQSQSAIPPKGNIAKLFSQLPPATGRMAGNTKWVQNLNAKIGQLATSTDNVLIVGERGTGKRLVAHLIHFAGPKKQQPLFYLDCAKPPPTHRIDENVSPGKSDSYYLEIAQEEALFGHGAKGHHSETLRRGYLELSDGGTIALANIDMLTPKVQWLLIQYLQGGTFARKGEKEQILSRVRIIATNTKSLAQLAEEGSFDRRLMTLIGQEVVTLKPLRERKKDISFLAEDFLREFSQKYAKNFSGFSEGALSLLVSHSWPLNVDGLRQTVERAVAIATGPTIEESQVFLHVPTYSSTGKFNLLKLPFVKQLVSYEWFPGAIKYLTVPFLFVLIIITLFGPPQNNPANLMVWALWWPFLLFSVVVSGRSWCSYCPLPIVSEGSIFRRNKTATIPSFVARNSLWFGIAGLAIILIWEYLAHMFVVPRATGALLVSIVGSIVAVNFIWGKMAWCKYFCPLGTILSQSSPLSVLELDSNSSVCAGQCLTHDCVKDGNCPMDLHPFAVANSHDCVMCLSCVKRCQHQAVRLNLRLPWRELLVKEKLEVVGAVFPLLLIALVMAVKLPTWEPVAAYLGKDYVSNSSILNLLASFVIATIFFAAISIVSGFDLKGRRWRNLVVFGHNYLFLAFAAFFNLYFHEFVYRGDRLLLWIVESLGLENVVPANWITPDFGTLKMLIPLITLAGGVSSFVMMVKLARKHDLSRYILRAHQTIIVLTTLVFIIVL